MRGIGIAAVSALFLFALTGLSGAGEGADRVGGLQAGKATVEKKCKFCHSLRLVLPKKKSRDEWTLTVKRMVTYGASLDAAERQNAISYLSARTNFARNCSGCHDPARVVPDDDSLRDWNQTIERMAVHIKELGDKGMAKGQTAPTRGEIEEIVAFLALILGSK